MAKVKFNSIVENLVPEYVSVQYPLLVTFLEEYFKSQEYQGAPLDLLENIEKYVQIDNIANLVDSTSLYFDANYFDSEIFVTSTEGFPKKNGLLQIGSEVISYREVIDEEFIESEVYISPGSSEVEFTSAQEENTFTGWVIKIKDSYGKVVFSSKILSTSDSNSVTVDGIPFPTTESDGYSSDELYQCEILRSKFTGCRRGFVGITEFKDTELVFDDSNVSKHYEGDEVKNLSILFLKEFFAKLKNQIAPGFEDGDFYEDLNESTFVKNIRQFYNAKGSDCSFELLFRALFGKDVEIARPSDSLIEPSSSRFRTSRDLIVRKIEGNILDLKNRTIYQDEEYGLDRSKGIVQNVETISKDEGIYYRIKLDDSSTNTEYIKGNFSIHASTRVVSDVNVNATSITVESTLGFPESGDLVFYKDGLEYKVSYGSKTNSQFIDCEGITVSIDTNTLININSYAYAKTKDGEIKFYVTGVLQPQSIESLIQTENLTKGDLFNFKSLGIELDDVRSGNWIYNIPVKYSVKSITFSDQENFTYLVELYQSHSVYIGDEVILSPTNTANKFTFNVVSYNNENSFFIRGSKVELDTNAIYTLEKKVSTGKYFGLGDYSSNVQNTYYSQDFDLVFVNSQSIPNYKPQLDSSVFQINRRTVDFSGDYSNQETIEIGQHPYFTGDAIVFKNTNPDNNSNLLDKVYYVEKVSDTKIKFYNSRSNIYNNTPIKISGTIVNGRLEFYKFNTRKLESLSIRPQNLLKIIPRSPINSGSEESRTTEYGTIGLLSNGVEILNYKSNDFIKYGSIESIIIRDQGSGYDVVNPPSLEIKDANGTGALANVSVSGSLKRIDITDKGFDYAETPRVSISGGNGSGASAVAEMEKYTYSIPFKSSGVSTSLNTISFADNHKFKTGEKVQYIVGVGTGNFISGLSTSSYYFVSIVDSKTIKLYPSFQDSVNQTNILSLSETASGKIKSELSKNRVKNIVVTNGGNNYTNNLQQASPSQINIFTDTINIDNHGYSDGEVVVYDATESPISGLTSAKSYYVTSIDKDNFRLSEIASSSGITSDYYYQRNEYISFDGTGSGYHKFNYPPISITITGRSNLSKSDLNEYTGALANPIVHGSITSVNLFEKGSNYGSEIIDYDTQPILTLLQGKDAKIKPFIVNGRIESVVITNSGSGYKSTPEIVIQGSGSNAILVPVIENEILTSVIVVNKGFGYSENTTLTVKNSGVNCNLYANIKSWRINLVERYINSTTIDVDDGFLYEGKLTNDGLQYTHLYASRSLRKSLLGKKIVSGKVKFTPDLELFDNVEIDSKSHSPIIGWAYDGNPIYGPYGYSTPSGGPIRSMLSGYSIKLKDNRPNPVEYPLGFFVEDYEFTSSGDLDKSNGRYCITPEFPNGTYAYFSTINSDISNSGVFANYKKPVFPYFVGNTYKSSKLVNNFNDFNESVYNTANLLRNTKPYTLNSNTSSYEFLNYDRNDSTLVSEVSSGIVTSVNVIVPGKDYRVGDRVIFESIDGQVKPEAFVSSINLTGINTISYESSIISNIVLLPNSGLYVGYSTEPHNLQNKSFGTISSKNNYSGSGNIGVSSNRLRLTKSVGSAVTGISSYFNVSGNISDIETNDVYEISNEKVKVIEIDRLGSRIRVIRNHLGTSGSAYSSGSLLVENPRKFTIPLSVGENFNYKLEREVYINPQESVGVGTSFGVGITSTLYFSDPGVGITQISIPTKSIYIPNHIFETGDQIVYKTNSVDSIAVSTDGITSSNLSDESSLYAYRVNSNLISISTVSSNISNNLLYFTGIGTGTYHSFTPQYQNIFSADLLQNEIVVSTASSHSLLLGDEYEVEITSNEEKTFAVEYNSENRRFVVGKVGFNTSDVDIVNNTIQILDHTFSTGDKVIYKSSSPSGGLVNNKIYYVVNTNQNKVQLANSKYEALNNESTVDITSSSNGEFLPINPKLDIVKYSKVIFDLSDSSLSYTSNGNQVPAFEFKIFKDKNFLDEFVFSGKSTSSEVTTTGTIGVSSNAKLTLTTSGFIPDNLYYSLIPIVNSDSVDENLQIVVDTETKENSTISLFNSLYNKTYTVSSIKKEEFRSYLDFIPEESEYNEDNSDIKVTYSSIGVGSDVKGSIDKITVSSYGDNIKTLPKITSIDTEYGSDAILSPNGLSVGVALESKLFDIGYDYPVDSTLRPTLSSPTILKIDYFSYIKNIIVLSKGKNYNVAPDLILLDGLDGSVVNGPVFKYDLEKTKVNIIKNVDELNSYKPTLFPVNNSNGIGITALNYNSSSKIVTVTLGRSFNSEDEFPFEVGKKILVEGISVGIGSTLRGYNSSTYDYSLFKVIDLDANIGGAGATVSYSMEGYASDGEDLGTFDSINSLGKIVPESYLPKFDVTTENYTFFVGEKVVSGESEGTIVSQNKNLNLIKLSTTDTFEKDTKITGKSSGRIARVIDATQSITSLNVDGSSKVPGEWIDQKGFLNESTQRIHDSDFYLYFSYEVKSEVDYESWNPYVSNLNHTAGFKKFSNMINISKSDYVGIETSQSGSDFLGISFVNSDVDLDCYPDFDLVREYNNVIDGKITSKEIQFKSKLLQDYINSVSNFAFTIDNLSDQFNSNPRAERYSVVDLSVKRYKKYLMYIVDRGNPFDRQLELISVLNNSSNVYLNEYAKISTFGDIGSFDGIISGDQVELQFFPNKFAVDNYDLFSISLDYNSDNTGIGSTVSLGDSVELFTSQTEGVGFGTTSVIGISSDFRTSKLIVSFETDNNSYRQIDELLLSHDGSSVEVLEYGNLVSNNDSFYSGNIGEYSATISGSEIILDFNVTSGIGSTEAYTINTHSVSIANTSLTGVGSTSINAGRLVSNYTSISSSPTPTSNPVAIISNDYEGSYFVVSVENTTDNTYRSSELALIIDFNNSDTYLTEYAITGSDTGIGTFGSDVSGTDCRLLFTPSADIDVEVRVFQMDVGIYDTFSLDATIDQNNFEISSNFGEYEGTDIDIKKSFDLTHRGYPIFQKKFDSSDAGIVSTTDNTIYIPGHFFVSGEKVSYSYPISESPISIASTNIPGIGVTDILPSEAYVIKVNDLTIKLAASAEDAMSPVPNELDITSVGIGTNHTLTAQKQNTKSLISIDNIIQSPIVGSSVTTTLSSNIDQFVTQITLSDFSNFYGGDLIEIGGEIFRVLVVGIGGSANDALVQRGLLGTLKTNHLSGDVIEKITGNYNIVGNTLHFIEAPYGNVPFTNPLDRPDELDYFNLDVDSTFNGRVFFRTGLEGQTTETYSENYTIDSLSSEFTGITSQFTLTSEGTNVTGISTGNSIILINNVFQSPEKNGVTFVPGAYDLEESSGVTTITFTGFESDSYDDINTSKYPRGGIIVSIASSAGTGYQPLISAGGTAIVSAGGTIQSISIGYSGSGYRSGIQTNVRVGVSTDILNAPLEFVGVASISNGNVISVDITNPGSGYTTSNPPEVFFDDPLPYNDLNLIYSSTSSGVGTGAKINLQVGQGSTTGQFELTNTGYGYNVGDVLTVSVGGTTGIQTSSPFEEFRIEVDSIYQDDFSGWRFGDLDVIDSISDLIDGIRRFFPIKIDGVQTSLKTPKGSRIDLQSTLLVFVNDVLQVPGEGYIFTDGSIIEFPEAPLEGSKVNILFYKGTSSVDTVSVDLVEPVEIGDTLIISSDDPTYQEEDRVVSQIINTDTLQTTLYTGVGIDTSESIIRPVTLCKQRYDVIVDGISDSGKSRNEYEGYVNPNTNIIKSVGTGSTIIFVESVKSFFDNSSEYVQDGTVDIPQKTVYIINQDTLVGASATAVVSAAGTISSIIIGNGGVGYSTNPTISIQSSAGIGTTSAVNATASATISVGGTVNSISITNSGVGYTTTEPPLVIISSPVVEFEEISGVSYEGDFGIITGISTVSVGVASTGIELDLFIPETSVIRDSDIVGSSATTISGIQSGYYFVIKNSNVGNGVTSLDSGGSIISIGSTFIDNVYEVASVSIGQTDVPGVGSTSVAKVIVSIDDYNGLSGLGYSSFYGEYSWGRLSSLTRKNPKEFDVYNNGIIGINTSAIVIRKNRLRYFGYS